MRSAIYVFWQNRLSLQWFQICTISGQKIINFQPGYCIGENGKLKLILQIKTKYGTTYDKWIMQNQIKSHQFEYKLLWTNMSAS